MSTARGSSLWVVESPAKALTLRALLPAGDRVLATGGHVRDLPGGRLGLDPERGFAEELTVLRGQGRVLQRLHAEARGAGRVLLALDPDREGEAIALQIAGELGERRGVERVRLAALTATGLQEGLAAAGPVDLALAEAQRARRIADRLIGWGVHALLRRRLPAASGAGRLTLAALGLLREREQALAATPRFQLRLRAGGAAWVAVDRDGELLELSDGEARTRAGQLVVAMDPAGGRAPSSGELARKGLVTGSPRLSGPARGSTAAFLAQVATELGLSPATTMAQLQRLYEGVPLADGRVGLVTYPRTEGEGSAHGPLGPADPSLLPGAVAGQLPRTAARLYARLHDGAARGAAGEPRLELGGGWFAPLRAAAPRSARAGAFLALRAVSVAPLPAEGEGELLLALHRAGVGRASTLAGALEALATRGYVKRQGRALSLEPLGERVLCAVEERWPALVTAGFTAGLEERLSSVAAGSTSAGELLEGMRGALPGLVELAAGRGGGARGGCVRCGCALVQGVGAVRCGGWPACTGPRPR